MSGSYILKLIKTVIVEDIFSDDASYEVICHPFTFLGGKTVF